jgi:hypothetical protein
VRNEQGEYFLYFFCLFVLFFQLFLLVCRAASSMTKAIFSIYLECVDFLFYFRCRLNQPFFVSQSMDDAWLDPQDRDQRIRKAQQEEIKNNMPRSSAPLTFSLLPVTKSNSANSFGVSSSTITMQSQSGSRTVIQSSNSKQSKSSASYFTNDTLTGSAHRVYSALLARRPISTIRPQLHVEKQKNQLLSALTPESSADDKPSGGVKPIPEDPDKSKSQAFDLAAIARIEKEWRTQDSKFVNFRQVPFASTSNFDSESRMCLSMHQPWASLLVAGIKRLEVFCIFRSMVSCLDEKNSTVCFQGRSWFSSYRGILWIHAAAHEASSEEIESLTSMYRSLYKTSVYVSLSLNIVVI